jgi:tetratricopeptide (TPR) repeat protein
MSNDHPINLKKLAAGAVLGASLAGVGGLFLLTGSPSDQPSTPTRDVAVAPSPASVEEEPIEVTVTHEPVMELAIEEAAEVEAARPVVALPHSEPDKDFLASSATLLAEGDAQGAFAELRHHVFTNPPTPEVLLQIGRLGRAVGQLAVAEEALTAASNLAPEDPDVLVELGRVRLEAASYAGARQAAEAAIRIDRDHAEAWNVRGRVAIAESEWHRAAESFEEAIRLDPGSAIAHNNAGLTYIYMKRGSDAVGVLETAVELYGEDVPHFVYNNLGLAHELAGNYEEARAAFEEALLTNPFYARAKVNLRRVEATLASIAEESAFRTAQGETFEAPPALEGTADGT